MNEQTAEQVRHAVAVRLNTPLDAVFVLKTWYEGDDISGTSGGTSIKKMTFDALLSDMQDDSYFESFDECETLPALLNAYCDLIDTGCGWGIISVLPEVEHNHIERDQQRKELEQLASQIAYQHSVKVDSIEFIRVLDQELENIRNDREQWNNPEVRAEEWAACQYAGVGSEVYFDDLNFENGRYEARCNTLHDVMDWLGENCPLLMAKYHEIQLEEE